MRISDGSSDVCSSDLHEPKKAGPIIDPVCGMAVDPAITVHHAAHGGETYHFCSAGCRTKFLADPQRYIGSSVSSVRVAEGTIWTRSEEHTSELQSLMRISYAVFCLNKKKESQMTK